MRRISSSCAVAGRAASRVAARMVFLIVLLTLGELQERPFGAGGAPAPTYLRRSGAQAGRDAAAEPAGPDDQAIESPGTMNKPARRVKEIVCYDRGWASAG